MNICFFTINFEGNIIYPTDRLKKSIEKFYPNTPFIVYKKEEIKKLNDPLFSTRATASCVFALMKECDTVIKIKHNFELLSKIDEFIEGNYSAVVVKNLFNEQKLIWDINPIAYLTTDFIIIKSKDYAVQWLDMSCLDNMKKYKNKEEDKLNILTYYGDMTVKILDKKDLEE